MPEYASDPGYFIAGGQGGQIFHSNCANVCVPDVARTIPGCSLGETTDCGRLTLSVNYEAATSGAACFGNPACINIEARIKLDVYNAFGSLVISPVPGLVSLFGEGAL